MANLLIKTIKLANQPGIDIEDVCKKAKVSRRWFFMLKKGELKDPGVSKVERINKVLSEVRA